MLNDDPDTPLRHTAAMTLYLFLQLDGPAIWIGADAAVAVSDMQASFVVLDEVGLHRYSRAAAVLRALGDENQSGEVFEYE